MKSKSIIKPKEIAKLPLLIKQKILEYYEKNEREELERKRQEKYAAPYWERIDQERRWRMHENDNMLSKRCKVQIFTSFFGCLLVPTIVLFWLNHCIQIQGYVTSISTFINVTHFINVKHAINIYNCTVDIGYNYTIISNNQENTLYNKNASYTNIFNNSDDAIYFITQYTNNYKVGEKTNIYMRYVDNSDTGQLEKCLPKEDNQTYVIAVLLALAVSLIFVAIIFQTCFDLVGHQRRMRQFQEWLDL